MGDQPLYKPSHSGNGTDGGYFQQQPNPMATMSGGLNHNYGSSSLEPPQSSPVSPHFPHDPGDGSAGAAMPVSAKGYSEMTEAAKGTGSWTGSGNHHQSSLVNSNLMWGSPSPEESTDPGSARSYQYSCTAQTAADGQPKVTSSVLQKLDSFTQVFANQNLRIHQGSADGNGHSLAEHGQSAASSSLADITADSALRQLLSQKPHLHEQTQETPVQQQQRYQLEQQQMQRSFDATQPKSQQITDVQQQQLYYEYQQQQHRVAQMQHLQALQQRQQMQSLQSQQHMLQHQQAQYYLQQQQKPQQQSAHVLLQQLQQQRSTYYHKQAQAAMHHLQQQQMQPLSPPPPYHQNRKIVQHQLQYSPQEQAHPVQHIQLSSGAAPYYYQEQQQTASTQQQYHIQVYQQNAHLQQQVEEERALQSPPKQYLLEPSCQLQNPGDPAATAVSGLPEGRNDGLACSEVLPHMGLPSPPHQPQRCVREALPTMQLASGKGAQKQQSPSTLWPQVSLTSERRRDPTSPDHSSLNNTGFLERVEVKNKLVCSMCQKEFKSLPALNGHMRSHGGTRTAPSPKQDEGDKQVPKEVDPLLPIVMPVSVPIKLPPAVRPAADLAPTPCCPPDRDMPVLVRMAESPPLPTPPPSLPASQQPLQQSPHSFAAAHPASSKSVRKPLKNEKAGGVSAGRGHPDKKKYRHRPDPLIIPPPSLGLVLGGAVLFQSQLRSPRIQGEIPPYTPPPMLSPVRHAPGLFSSILHTGVPPIIPITPRVLLGRASSADGSSVPVTPRPGEQAVDTEPHINIGPRFQAQIPELQSRSAVEGDQHKANMVWTPRAELQSPGARQRVEDLVNMACSSVLPGGGTNAEYALHCLFETRGDFMDTVEKLLLLKPMRPKSHPLADYHYAGSDKWTPLEKKQFNKALATHNKDFSLIQKTVKTKTVSQCVEYYYTWKKKLRLGKRHRTRQADINDEDMSGEGEDVESDELEEDSKSGEEEEPEAPKSPDLLGKTSLEPEAYQDSVQLSTFFVCEMPNCGAAFSSMQALNGHARIHGGTNQVTKPSPRGKPKAMSQSGYGSVKSSPAHSTTSGEADPTLIFPCKECGKVFFKIKSRNAHMKTHRQQEEQERKKQQQQQGAQEVTGPIMLPLDHMDLIKPHGAQSEALHTHLLLTDDLEDFLQDCKEGL
ncbi:transcriptional-regulating factor 1 isoform X3 [Acipenser ruthenus]|uniref:transcriptional-regulating factor 1 isoform X3 n=1 Tax=Acipenser ruthenus TaxID=7906 RepID=UPI00145AE1C3|nr:transcriptional-regulating factor 1 isoform X3 [Acipenser ruthenus]